MGLCLVPVSCCLAIKARTLLRKEEKSKLWQKIIAKALSETELTCRELTGNRKGEDYNEEEGKERRDGGRHASDWH